MLGKMKMMWKWLCLNLFYGKSFIVGRFVAAMSGWVTGI